jgi:thiamine-monophosphate kinase
VWLLSVRYIEVVLPFLEKAVIAKIRRRSRVWPGVVSGIGDDCAALRIPASEEVLVTTDFSLEGVHFRREWHPPESVGHRCLTRGLSDIAAMGGRPIAAFLSLALPRKLDQKWVDRFFQGFTRLADRHQVTLAGGDIAQSPCGVLADIIVLGVVPRGKAVLRSGARPGDLVYVSGELGGSAAVLQELRKGGRKKLDSSIHARYFFPEPRLELGQFLRQRGLATSMIDISDGLSTDLGHICEESGVGARLTGNLIPHPRMATSGNKTSLRLALHGGEDYELLFTAAREKKIPRKIADVAITQIGAITRGKGMVLANESGKASTLHAQGWQHFS